MGNWSKIDAAPISTHGWVSAVMHVASPSMEKEMCPEVYPNRNPIIPAHPSTSQFRAEGRATAKGKASAIAPKLK